jgi:hypothetical protein
MRTMEEDNRLTDLLRTYDHTVAELAQLGVDIVLARGGGIEWRVKTEHPRNRPIYDDMRNQAQAREWIALAHADYPHTKYTIELRRVFGWEPVEPAQNDY